jgi:hypothetical protein
MNRRDGQPDVFIDDRMITPSQYPPPTSRQQEDKHDTSETCATREDLSSQQARTINFRGTGFAMIYTCHFSLEGYLATGALRFKLYLLLIRPGRLLRVPFHRDHPS